ncbi:hypothetical protein BDQ17DRAFT_1329486 [Cyathus striatus]|nr:hypothetical protein BDQ17DRAFT_1329486 [Cyathus striatus]
MPSRDFGPFAISKVPSSNRYKMEDLASQKHTLAVSGSSAQYETSRVVRKNQYTHNQTHAQGTPPPLHALRCRTQMGDIKNRTAGPPLQSTKETFPMRDGLANRYGRTPRNGMGVVTVSGRMSVLGRVGYWSRTEVSLTTTYARCADMRVNIDVEMRIGAVGPTHAGSLCKVTLSTSACMRHGTPLAGGRGSNPIRYRK